MKYFNRIWLIITAFLLFILFISTNTYADILILIDDTTIQGKIVREDERVFYFTTASGTFEVKKVHLKKIIKTNSYKEDIALALENGVTIDETKAKENYTTGERKLMLMSRKRGKKRKYYEWWDYGRLSLSFSYFATITEDAAGSTTVNSVLPSGFSGQIAYEQGLDMLIDLYKSKKKKKIEENKRRKKYRKTKQRPMWLPGIRVELNYMYFTKDLFVNDDKEVSGMLSTTGLMWYFPSPHNVWGCFMLAVMPGYSFLRVNNRSANIIKDNYAFGMTLIFGYEYAIKERVALLFHARYTYIADAFIAFHGIGASFGVSIRLW